MARLVAGFLAGGVAAGLLLIAAGQAPALGDDTKPVVAGSFNVKADVGRSGLPDGFKSPPGIRTYTFGSGCAAGASCTLTRTTPKGGAPVQSPLTPSGRGFSWKFSESLNCLDTVTGALKTPNGADHTIVARLLPSATTVRDGVTYVTAMRGTMDNTITVNARGRADNCTIPPNSSTSETEHSVLTATLVPLAVPPTSTSPTPLGLGGGNARTTGTIPAFELPQTARQIKSAAAVASGSRSSVPGALVTPSEAVRTVGERLPQDLLLVALLGLLIVFPAQVFNSTYEENHERIDRQLARLRRRRARPFIPAQAVGPGQSAPTVSSPPRARRITVFLACVIAGTLLAGLLDPKFGATTASYALVLGVFAAVLVAVVVSAFAGRFFRSATHRASGWYLRAIPSALLVAAVCVLVSRLTHFAPGYLYGVLGGAVFAAALERKSEGRAEVTVALTGLVLALLAWIAFEPVAGAADGLDPSLGLLSLDAFLASLFIGGLEGLLFGLVPLRFLPGARIKGWSWVAWGALMVVVLYTFVHVLLMPASGYLGKSTAASVTVTLALFISFAVVSGLFWLYFRLRPGVGDSEAEPVADTAAEPGTSVAPVSAQGVGVVVESLPLAPPPRVPVDATGEAVQGAPPQVPHQSGSPKEES